jgi:hypothetical protein
MRESEREREGERIAQKELSVRERAAAHANLQVVEKLSEARDAELDAKESGRCGEDACRRVRSLPRGKIVVCDIFLSLPRLLSKFRLLCDTFTRMTLEIIRSATQSFRSWRVMLVRR